MWKTIKHKVELLWQIRESKDMKGRRARENETETEAEAGFCS